MGPIVKSAWVVLALVGVVGAVIAADAPADKKAPDDAAAIQGTWQAQSRRVGDRPPAGDADQHRLVFEKDGFRLMRGDDAVARGTFTIDASKTPRAIDMKLTEGEDEVAGKTARGIYEIKGDELKWCSAQPGLEDRPKGFDVSGTDHMLVTARRAAPAAEKK